MKRAREPSGSSSSNEPPKKAQKTSPSQYKQLRVEDALAYLEQVKQKFKDKPNVYIQFLDIMKEFKTQTIDTPGVINRVSELFKGNIALILGFNTFLPPGYKIELDEETQSLYTTTPATTAAKEKAAQQQLQQQQQQQEAASSSSAKDVKPAPVANAQSAQSSLPVQSQQPKQAIDFDQAINYVTKIKIRFQDQPDTYKAFLDILHTYQKEQTTIKKVYEQVSTLFKDHPDLLDEFAQFLPVPVSQPGNKKKQAKPKSSKKVEVSNRRKRTSAKKADELIKRQSSTGGNVETESENFNGFEDSVSGFFERVKQRLQDNSLSYKEMLKCISMYTSGVINKGQLLDLVEDIIGSHADLFGMFQKLVLNNDFNGIDDRLFENRKDLASKTNIGKYGPSYRILPRNFPQPLCSERSDLCNEVLNDELVSVPAGSEEARDSHNKKTQFDEILYQCEDDRCELDIVIEQNISTLRFLTPLADKIKSGETITFQYEQLRDIHRASIARIYGDKGTDILEGLRKSPTIAIPIVLKRLKQKDDEWQNARKELNKFWREIYEKNFDKAVENQATTFKQFDKKKLNARHIITDLAQRSEYNKDLVVLIKDTVTHADILSLILSSEQAVSDLEAIKTLWRKLIAPFFCISTKAASPSTTATSTTTTTTSKEGEDIARLLEEDVKNDDSTTSKDLFVPVVEQALGKPPSKQYFYANETIVLFMRYYQMLFHRLSKARESAIKNAARKYTVNADIIKKHEGLADNSKRTGSNSTPTDEAQMNAEGGLTQEELENRQVGLGNYRAFLKILHQFLQGGLEALKFEEESKKLLGNDGFIVYTMDKLFANILRQLHSIVTDEQSTRLIDAYHYERCRVNRMLDKSYLLHVQKLVGNDIIYFFKFNPDTRKMNIHIGTVPEIDAEREKAERIGLKYVEKFLSVPQLQAQEEAAASTITSSTTPTTSSTTPTNPPKRVFLMRNKKQMPDDQVHKNVTISNGLECKICIATLKLFFVEDTEDVFFRARGKKRSLSSNTKSKQDKAKKWLETRLAQLPQNDMDTSEV